MDIKVLTNQLLNSFTKEKKEHHFEDSEYQISVRKEPYVLEYWHTNKDNLEEVGKWQYSQKIKSRENYQVMDCLYAFQFYDLEWIKINGEYVEGKKKQNISPMIYIGQRHYLNKPVQINKTIEHSIIIDKDGDYHPGSTGITYDEYLEILGKKKSNSTRIKKLEKIN